MLREITPVLSDQKIWVRRFVIPLLHITKVFLPSKILETMDYAGSIYCSKKSVDEIFGTVILRQTWLNQFNPTKPLLTSQKRKSAPFIFCTLRAAPTLAVLGLLIVICNSLVSENVSRTSKQIFSSPLSLWYEIPSIFHCISCDHSDVYNAFDWTNEL